MNLAPSKSPDRIKGAAGTWLFEVADVEAVKADCPTNGLIRLELKSKPKVVECDILIVGGGMGGVAAALRLAQSRYRVCLVESTSWLGGQLSAQGVSALDENYLVETSGATKTYQEMRREIRKHYAALGAVQKNPRFGPELDPGDSWVSRLAFEAKVGVKVINELLQGALDRKQLRIFYRLYPLQVKVVQGKIASVLMGNAATSEFMEFRCRFCLDATELGDLLPLAEIPYRSGAESHEETGEEHAPLVANPDNVQDFTYPFVVEYRPGENHRINKPPHYDDFCRQKKFGFAGYKMFESSKTKDAAGNEIEHLPFWEYRRLVAAANFPRKVFSQDIAMINWESNDLRGENIIDKSPADVLEKLALGKSLSLGFLYWLQTEAPRDDGGSGYPELKLRPDLLDTEDGLSKYPYIRESRRIKAIYTIAESDISAKTNSGARAKIFFDSVGIGLYPIDIHGWQEVSGAGQATKPFQIPFAAMVQKRIRNFLPAGKNIGTTHVTNGAYRLHPIEWSLGEAAAITALLCLENRTDPEKILRNRRQLRQLQINLVAAGVPLYWYEDVLPEHPAFEAIQFLAVSGLFAGKEDNLRFRPEDPLTRAELAQSLARLFQLDTKNGKSMEVRGVESSHPFSRAIYLCLAEGLLAVDGEGKFLPDLVVTGEELEALSKHAFFQGRLKIPQCKVVSRASYAIMLFAIAGRPQFLGKH